MRCQPGVAVILCESAELTRLSMSPVGPLSPKLPFPRISRSEIGKLAWPLGRFLETRLFGSRP